MDILTIIVGSIAIFTASFFASVSGFGYALIATPLLSTVVPLKTTIIFILFLTMIMRVFTMYTTFHDMDIKTVATVSIGCLIGIQPGSWVLNYLSAPTLGLYLSVALLFFITLNVINFRFVIKKQTLGRLGCGIVSGFFGASTSVSGPPIVLYFLNEDMEKTLMRSNMTWIFGFTLLSTAITYFFTGAYNFVEDWTVFYYLVPANLVGVFLGECCAKKLSQELFRKLTLIIVTLGTIMMLINSIQRL